MDFFDVLNRLPVLKAKKIPTDKLFFAVCRSCHSILENPQQRCGLRSRPRLSLAKVEARNLLQQHSGNITFSCLFFVTGIHWRACSNAYIY